MGQPLPGHQPGSALAAQLYQESGWDPKVVSPADARGIAQFIPDTWATHGIDGNGDGKRDIWDPADAIPSAASYDCELAKYVKDVPGDTTETCSPRTTPGPTGSSSRAVSRTSRRPRAT
ncbi:hypothetical protein Sviol_82240 [Streptomyces violascens]|uniref:Transglycosylase SLT domain-containing protein n=1 Tax=Streptomyces violascens TaxID=67381 RepID=A0ABQ3R2Q5_9ACTN|nr:hypothetical protein Sviol_82240 [Streptomyces violascens]